MAITYDITTDIRFLQGKKVGEKNAAALLREERKNAAALLREERKKMAAQNAELQKKIDAEKAELQKKIDAEKIETQNQVIGVLLEMGMEEQHIALKLHIALDRVLAVKQQLKK